MHRLFKAAALFSLLVLYVAMAVAQESGVGAGTETTTGPGISGPVSGPDADAMLRGPLPALAV